jgi:hypothetical protein
MATPKAQFIPTQTIRFQKNNFQTVLSMAYDRDGFHTISLEDLVKGEGKSQIDEGSHIAGLVVEAAGETEVDYEAVLKCKVIDGMVDAIYTPGIMGAEDKLFLVSGDNRFPITYDSENDRFVVGQLTGKLTEREYDRADGSKGRAVSVLFAPNDKNLKVIYDIPVIFQKWEKIADKLPEGAEVSKELVDWILGEEWVEIPEDKGIGVKLLSSIVLPTLGSGGILTHQKLPELGEGAWKLADWVKMPQQAPKKDGEKPLPASYQLFLSDFNGVPLPNAYYSNKAIQEQLDTMTPTFRGYLEEGRELQLKTSSPYKIGQYNAIKAVIQLLPPSAGAVGMKSAAVELKKLPQSKQSLQPADGSAVDVTATTVVNENVEAKAPNYDPLPF